MGLFMETTKVSESNTVAALQHLLATRGASAVQVQYDKGKIEGLQFILLVGEQPLHFMLPCRWQAIDKILRGKRRSPPAGDTWESMARRVGWRQILRWVEAQLALIETGMVKTEEVFLPYMTFRKDGKQQTMHELVQEKKYFALTGPTNGDE